jgi:hypothetical protein
VSGARNHVYSVAVTGQDARHGLDHAFEPFVLRHAVRFLITNQRLWRTMTFCCTHRWFSITVSWHDQWVRVPLGQESRPCSLNSKKEERKLSILKPIDEAIYMDGDRVTER